MSYCRRVLLIVCGRGESLDQAHVPSDMASIGVAGPVSVQKQQQSTRHEFNSSPGIAQPPQPNVARLLRSADDDFVGASTSTSARTSSGNGNRRPCNAIVRIVLNEEQIKSSRSVASELHARRRASMASFLGATDGPGGGTSGSDGFVYGSGGLLTCTEVKLMAWQLARALKQLHDRKIVHRDIRPANLLIDDAGVLKLADFGSARALRDKTPRARGSQPQSSRWRLAPEVIAGQSHGLHADIWSYGCTVAELATGKPLFPGSSHADQLLQIMRFCCLPPYDPHEFLRKQLSSAADGSANSGGTHGGRGSSAPHSLLIRLLESCLRLDPNDRSTADQVLNSPYFYDVPNLIRNTQLEAALLYDSDSTAEMSSSGGPPSAPVASGSSAAAPPMRFDSSSSCASTTITTTTGETATVTANTTTTTTTTGITGASAATTARTGVAATCIISAAGGGSAPAKYSVATASSWTS